MSIERIDKEKCIGCKKCINACLMDVIRWDEAEKKPVIAYPIDCYCCYHCEIGCPVKAIYVNPVPLHPVPPSWG